MNHVYLNVLDMNHGYLCLFILGKPEVGILSITQLKTNCCFVCYTSIRYIFLYQYWSLVKKLVNYLLLVELLDHGMVCLWRLSRQRVFEFLRVH